MPYSDADGKDIVKGWYKKIAPRVIVDIGPGQGTYSDLLRNKSAKATWYGIEAWGPYVTEFNLWKKYDRIIVSDIRHVDLMTVHYAPDLVIAGDVLEHMAKDESEVVLQKFRAWADNIIVSVPLAHHDQGAYKGNWFEHHQDHWNHEEMVQFLGAGLKDSFEGRILGCYWWSREEATGD